MSAAKAGNPDSPNPAMPPSRALLRSRTHALSLPGGRALQVHRIDFDDAAFEPTDFRLAGLACPAPVARSARKRQAEFFFGRVAARAALQAIGQSPTPLPIGASGAPQWPAGVFGSISHAQGVAVAAALRVGHDGAGIRGLGIDVEHVVDETTRPALLDMVLDADELARLEAHAGAPLSRDALITLVFSAKESLYKAAHASVGRFFGFEAARLSALHPAEGRLTLTIAEHLNDEFACRRRCELSFVMLDDRTVLSAFLSDA